MKPIKLISSADAREFPALAKHIGKELSAQEYNSIIHGKKAEAEVEEAPKKAKK